MPHAHETLLRDAYAAFARGDIDGYWSVCSPDFVFNVPGRNVMAGTYRGKDAFMAMVGKVMQLSGGQFQETVHDILANDEHGIVLATHRFSRNGRTYEYNTAHVYHVRDGRLIEAWEQPQDQTLFDEAWT